MHDQRVGGRLKRRTRTIHEIYLDFGKMTDKNNTFCCKSEKPITARWGYKPEKIVRIETP
jgi:hypothetical protein